MNRFLPATATVAIAFMLAAGAAHADYKLTLLHTNDFHDRFEPITKYDSTCSAKDNAEGKCFGGMARMVTAIEAAKARHDNVLLVDAGDQFQGTLFHQLYQGDMVAEFMNKLGYDAMAVGNHEFDNGPGVLAAFIRQVDFPVLMSNADLAGEPELQALVVRRSVIEKAGEPIGLVGVTPRNNDELSAPGPNVVFTDPSPAIQAEVDALTAEGVNKIIVLSHSGYATDNVIALNTSNVDVIVGGHSNTFLSNTDEKAVGPYPDMVNGVAIVQAYAYGKYLGELALSFDDAGSLTHAMGEPILLDASVAEDPATKARIAELAKPLDELRNRVVAEAVTAIDGERTSCRAGECAMGSLIAAAMLERVRDQGIDIALQNGGGVRASIDAGPITMGEVLTVLPFQNTLSTFQVTGATLLAALENGVSQIEDGAGRFAQVAGMRYTFDPQRPAGERIIDVQVNGAPLDMDRIYGVVSNNYVRGGGDGYAMFRDAMNAYDFGPDLADVVAQWLAARSPLEATTDGRIAIAN